MTKKILCFKKNDTGYLNADNTRSFYSLTKIDGSKQYFAEDGRLLGITDRFGNKIDFEYEMYPLVNRMPGGTFDCQDTMWSIVGTRNYDFETTMGQKDTTSLRVSANNYEDVIIRSQPIQLEPQGDYQFAASFYSTNGNENVTMTFHEYDLYHRSTGFTKTFTKEDLVQGEWNSFEAPYHITSSATRYVVLEITVEYGIYNLYIDNVTLDQPKPLISKITDTIGRTVTFDYVGSVFEGDNIGDVILTVSSPDGSQTKTMTYHKGSVTYTTTFVGKEDALTFWYLDYSDTEGSNGADMADTRNDNKTHYYYDGSVGPDGNHINLYYHPNRKTQSSTDSYHHMHPLGGVMYKNRVKIYDYEVVRKHLGNNGYTDLLRVSDRYESYFNCNLQDGKAYETGELNKIQFDYQGSYTDSSTGATVTFDSEDGYPNYHFSNGTTFGEEWSCTKTAKKQETFTFTNAKLVRNSVSDSNTGISQTNHYEYDSTFSNQPSAIKNVVSNGSDTRELYSLFSYDEKGNVASESQPVTADIKNDATLLAKHTTSYEYSPHGFIAKKHYYQTVDGDRITEQNYYDSIGRLTKSVNAMGGETEYSYEDATYPGNVTMVSQEDPANLHGLMDSQKSILYLYDDYGLYPEVTIDVSDGIVSNTFTGYDYIYGNLLYTVYPDEGVEQFCYNEDGSIAKHLYPIIQNNGSQFRMLEVYEYFASCEVDMGNGFYPLLERVIVKKYEYPEDWEEVYYHAQEEKFYSTSGNLLHQIVHDIADQYLNEDGQIATPAIKNYYYYDNYDRLIKTVDALNQSVNYTYDNFDRVTTVTDPENNSYHYSYDDLALTSDYYLHASSGEESNHLTVQSDIYGNILSLTAYPDGINGSTLTESFEYDLLGNCVEHTNPRGAVTQYSYDKVNHLTQTVLPDGTIAVSSYSEFDTPVTEKVKDAEGNDKLSRLYYYDGKGNTQTKFYHYNAKLTDVNSYSYDSKNRVIESSEYGQQFQYDYDQVNNLISKQAGEESIDYRYNQYGEVISASFDDSTALLVSNYDDMGRLKSRIQQKSVEEGLWITFNNQYAYSVLNQVIASASPLNRIETYTYTPNGNLQTIVTDGKTISYEYNANGTIKQINYPNGLQTAYEYDNINRVTQMITSKGSTIINQMQYTYDENSNVISETRNNQTTQYSYDVLDRLLQVEYPDRTVAYEYDTIGNRTKETITTSDGTQVKEYSYNDRYQLTQIVTDGEVTDTYTYREDGALATHNETTYEYDQWNRLSSVTTGETTDTFGYDTHGIRTEKNDIYYSVDPNQHVNLEYDTSDDSVAEIVWGHQPLVRKVGNNWYYYIYNAHGDVIGLVNDAGTVVNNYTYDAWGNILSETETIENPIKYAGEYYDDELGMYYLRARYYDPKVGRFTSYDIQEGDIVNPLDMNRYVYCRNNPIKYIDPSGESLTIAGIVISGKALAILGSGIMIFAYLASEAFINAFTEAVKLGKSIWDSITYAKGKAKDPTPPSKLKDGDKVKTPKTHPDEFNKKKDGTYEHKKTGWQFKPDYSRHGGDHWDASPDGKSGNYINVNLDGTIR